MATAVARGAWGGRRVALRLPWRAGTSWIASAAASFSSSVPTTKLFIDGKFVESKTTEWIDIHNPATNEVVSRVPKATTSEMEAAVASCKKAFWNWSETSVLSRQQIFLRYQQLIKDNLKEISKLITFEQGKTLADAEGDVFRGLRKLLAPPVKKEALRTHRK
ncbi:hypothetical protein Q9233_009743 [Columba guinea]|nr:hypothetical protein Q9233_009743 [Columba guinea]